LIGLQRAPSDTEIDEAVHEATRVFLAAFGQGAASR